MPELPDIEAYRSALAGRVVGRGLAKVRLRSVFLLPTVEPALAAFEGRVVTGTRRIGKRLVMAFGAPTPAPAQNATRLAVPAGWISDNRE